ncbi:transporter [Cyanothece sp. BG0011]|uniref:transporter n=1 Tax=Cyanothece sp. BG0011 TaxID=2082950 RepID=UPI000D1D7438|nr:transporter [Cyanothece sp. BG0011]
MILLGISLLVILGISGFLLLRRFKALRVASVSLAVTILLLTTIAPALADTQVAALGARDETVSADETDLKLNPGAGHYSGLEYAERTNEVQNPVSDEVIKKTIDKKTDDRIVFAVSNGSVRLSGQIDNKEDAQNLISQIKEIPGVHEITFDLGLTDINS